MAFTLKKMVDTQTILTLVGLILIWSYSRYRNSKLSEPFSVSKKVGTFLQKLPFHSLNVVNWIPSWDLSQLFQTSSETFESRSAQSSHSFWVKKMGTSYIPRRRYFNWNKSETLVMWSKLKASFWIVGISFWLVKLSWDWIEEILMRVLQRNSVFGQSK